MNDNPQRVARLKACRFPLYISQFIDDSRTRLKCDGTIMDIENEFWELHIDYGHWRSDSETWQHVEDDAREWLRKQCPDMPERVMDRYIGTLQNDAARAIDATERDDYCAQFNKFLRDGIADAIDESLPDGAVWCWCDANGNPTTAFYECDRVLVAMPNRLAADKRAEWYQEDMNVSDMLAEWIADNAEKMRPDFFDDRGYRYGDSDGWQDRMGECGDSAADEWRADVKKMRARLRDMIANRAPLELRAALVATVYGNAGA